jgi:hypothetical protein
MSTSLCITGLPHLSHSMRRNHDGKARIGCCMAFCGVGSASVP